MPSVITTDRTLMLLDKFEYLAGNAGVGADVAMIHFPVAQLFHLCILGWHDANSDLCRLAQVRTVEGNRRNWPSPQSLPGFLSQALEKPIFQSYCSSATTAFTIDLADLRGCRELFPLRMQFPGGRGACAQIDQQTIHLRHPLKWIAFGEAGKRPPRVERLVPSVFSITRAFAWTVLSPTPNAAHRSAVDVYGVIDLSPRKLILPRT